MAKFDKIAKYLMNNRFAFSLYVDLEKPSNYIDDMERDKQICRRFTNMDIMCRVIINSHC